MRKRSEQFYSLFDDDISCFRSNGINAGLDFISAAGKTFLHGNVSGNILGKFHNKGVFAGAFFADRTCNTVETFAGKCGEHKIFADLDICHTAAVRGDTLFMAIQRTLCEVTQCCRNFVCQILTFKVAFLFDIRNGSKNVMSFCQFRFGKFAVGDRDCSVADFNGICFQRFQIFQGIEDDSCIAASDTDSFFKTGLFDIPAT